jgi:hypothetical protein
MTEELNPGDVVRVKDPDGYFVSFCNKIRDRDAVVEWAGPDANGMNVGRCCVMFQKRNGRGKEFREVMQISALLKVTA